MLGAVFEDQNSSTDEAKINLNVLNEGSGHDPAILMTSLLEFIFQA
jgi:hypothetical protein